MALELDLQNTLSAAESGRLGVPAQGQLERWIDAVLEGRCATAALTVRISDSEEIRELNRAYRHKDKPTNVLSFPFEAPPGVPLEALPPEERALGDIVICAEVVAREALEQEKALEAHWAHMVVHGTLHLLGYDHIEEAEAAQMEGLEIALMAALGYANPYE